MRTQEEIARRVREYYEDHAAGSIDTHKFSVEALVECLDFEHARAFLVESAKPTDWRGEILDTDAKVLARMRTYMEFAWDKVEDHRGVSSRRSIVKMETWLFAMGDTEALVALREIDFTNYGAPKLKYLCDRFGFPVPRDEGVQRMMQGLPCREGCEEGCGA